MTESPQEPDPRFDFALRLDDLCDRFEEQWQQGHRPDIQDFSAQLPTANSAEVFEELLAIELECRFRQGEEPSAQEYRSRFPQFGDRIEWVLSESRRRAEEAKGISAEAIAPNRSVLHIRCPHCHYPIEVLDDRPFGERTCPICGSSMGLGPLAAGLPAETGGAGRPLAHFVLIERIGEGSFGTVWKARDETAGRLVALKIPRVSSLNPDELDRFVREAQSAARCQHPGIVTVYEVGFEGSVFYIASQFIEGQSLQEHLRQLPEHRLGPREAAELCVQLAEALHHAHEAGVVHRDLKPANILLDRSGKPYITDFGLAKREASELSINPSGMIVGTVQYMSPEQARGESKSVDRRSDVYSLGTILFELLTGERPFRGTTETVLRQLQEDAPPSVRKLNSEVHRDLEAVCLRCLEKAAERRFGTARDLAEDLRRYLEHRPTRSRPVNGLERSCRWCRRNPVVAGLAAAVAVSLLIGTAASTYFAITASERASAEALARTNAESSEASARQSEDKAKAQAEAAEEARGREADHRRRAEVTTYANTVALAHQKWLAGNVYDAESLLAECPPELRHWEWGYLKRLCHLDFLTIHGLPVNHTTFPEICWSTDGGQVTCNGETWNVETGQRSSPRPLPIFLAGFCREVNAAPPWEESMSLSHAHEAIVVFSADGQRVAAGSRIQASETVAPQRDGPRVSGVWDIPSRKAIDHLSDPVSCMAFSHDAKLLACGTPTNEIQVIDIARGQRRTFIGHQGPIHRITFRSDGAQLASIGLDATVRTWDVTTGRELQVLQSPSEPARAVRFLADGARLAVAFPSELRIWDLNGGRLVCRLSFRNGLPMLPLSREQSATGAAPEDGEVQQQPQNHHKAADAVALSGDGKKLASVDFRVVHIWDVATGLETLTLRGHGARVIGAAFNADGTRLASFDEQGTLKIWDAVASREYSRWTGGCRPALSEDGQFLATTRKDMTAGNPAPPKPADEVCVFNVDSGEVSTRLPGPAQRIAWSPSSRYLLLADGNRVRIVEARTGKCILLVHNPLAENGAIDTLPAIFSHDERILAVPEAGQTTLWDLTRGQVVRRMPGWCIESFSPNGQYLCARRLAHAGATGAGSETRRNVWEVKSGRQLFRENRAETALVRDEWTYFAPDGLALVGTSRWGPNEYVDLASRIRVETGAMSGHAVAFSADGKHIAIGEGADSARIVERGSGRILKTCLADSGMHMYPGGFGPDGRFHVVFVDSPPASTVAFSRDARRLITGMSLARGIRFWSAPEFREIMAFPAAGTDTDEGLDNLMFSHDGIVLGCIGTNNTCVILKAAPDRVARQAGSADAAWKRELILARIDSSPDVRERRHSRLSEYEFSPDGRWFTCSRQGEAVNIWNALDGRRSANLPDVRGRSAFSEDVVALGPEDSVVGRLLGSIEGGLEIPYHVISFAASLRGDCVKRSRDGKRLAWADSKGVFVIDRKPLKSIARLAGHSARVNSIAFSYDGMRLATTSDDRTIRLWDLASGKTIAVVSDHDGAVWDAQFNADGSRLVSWSEDGTIRVWDVAKVLRLRQKPRWPEHPIFPKQDDFPPLPKIDPFRA